MEDQAKIVRLTILIVGGCVGLMLAGLIMIAIRNDGQVAVDIVGTFTQLATTGIGVLGAIITAYVIAHRPTTASVAQAAVAAGSTVSIPPNGVVTVAPTTTDTSSPQTAEG